LFKENRMHLQGDVTINAPRAQVYAYLTDPHKVSECAPGVESVEIIEPDKTFRGTVSIGFGTVKARFTGDVEWLELVAPERAKMKAHGRASGSAADVISEMSLSDLPGGATQLHWTADITIVGQLASLAARLMGTVSQKMTGLFFDCVRKKIEAAGPGQNATASSGAAAGSAA
jgi:carbon monoxide dehydrogenase subunit G